jgi:hypothetical protein
MSRVVSRVIASSGVALRTLGMLLAWLLVLDALGCSCSETSPLATLLEKSGSVERDFRASLRAWKPAEPGARFDIGDGIQTLRAGSALLQLDDGAQLSLKPETLIRFSATPPPARTLAFDVELGAASISTTGELSLQTAGGRTRLEPGTTVTLSHDAAGLRFVVQVGQAVFYDLPPLAAGQGVLLDGHGVVTPIARPTQPTRADAGAASPGAKQDPPNAPARGNVTALVRGARASVKTERGWSALPQGSTELPMGTELELARNTTVTLERGAESATLEQNGRYVVAPRDGVLVAAASGSLAAGGTGEVRVEVPGGVIVVAAAGQAKLHVNDKSTTRVEVQAREAVLETARGRERIAAGERATLAPGGEVSVEGRSLSYADIEITAGHSLVIHDPNPPTAARFLFAGVCPQTGVLTLARNGDKKGAFAAGRDAIALPVPAGTYRYELRCETADLKPARQGRLVVMKDGGTRAMAAHPPSTQLQADGRNYTVLYQNRLPDITLAWPNAPAATALRLVHEFAEATKTIELGEPSYHFPSGRLEEGQHQFYFAGDTKVSRKTTLDIRFDNAAPTALLNTPVAVKAQSGEPVTITGVALPGWDVRVEDHPAERDAQGRFFSSAIMPADRRGLVIWISHPSRGMHAYLRRGQS